MKNIYIYFFTSLSTETDDEILTKFKISTAFNHMFRMAILNLWDLYLTLNFFFQKYLLFFQNIFFPNSVQQPN